MIDFILLHETNGNEIVIPVSWIKYCEESTPEYTIVKTNDDQMLVSFRVKEKPSEILKQIKSIKNP